jgi:hypothetical protein
MNIKHGGEAGQQVGLLAVKSDWTDTEFLNECGRLNSSHGTRNSRERPSFFLLSKYLAPRNPQMSSNGGLP